MCVCVWKALLFRHPSYSEVSALLPFPALLCLSGRPYRFQRPEDNGECERYAWAQEDGLWNDSEEVLGLGRPAGKSR